MKVSTRNKKIERLNLIPILDAIFIFIFFLLMSAQFIDIYQVGSDAPVISEVDQEKNDKDPLNLKLKITRNQIVVTTGLDDQVVQKISHKNGEYNYKLLKETLSKIKKKNITEKSIILSPKNDVTYKNLIKVIDQVKATPKGMVIKGKNKKGETITTKKLFDQVIFETL